MNIKEHYKGYDIVIEADECPGYYRDWVEPFGKLYIKPNRYLDGDKEAHEPEADDISLPVYMYAHSNVAINTTGFSCPWDSGHVGFVYVSREKAIECFGNLPEPELLERTHELLKDEVDEYNRYLQGECYSYEINYMDETVDNCGIITDTSDNVLKECKSIIDHMETSEYGKTHRLKIACERVRILRDSIKTAVAAYPVDCKELSEVIDRIIFNMENPL